MSLLLIVALCSVAIEASAEMHGAFFCAPKVAAAKKAQLGVDRAVGNTHAKQSQHAHAKQSHFELK
ncbi:MAG: hypothetical protein ACKVJG_06385, partial [Candidatus Latescibacterota bacterium]